MPTLAVQGVSQLSNWSETETALGPASIKLKQVTCAKRYVNAEMHGVGECCLSYSDLPGGGAEFTGYELFSGMLDSHRGSFVMQISGTVDLVTKVSEAEVIIHPGSGCDELHAISGAGSFVVSPNGLCNFEMRFK